MTVVGKENAPQSGRGIHEDSLSSTTSALCSAFLICPELGLITEDHVLKHLATGFPLTGQMNSQSEKLEVSQGLRDSSQSPCLPHTGPVPKPRVTGLFTADFSTVHPPGSVIQSLLLGHGDCGRWHCPFYSLAPSYRSAQGLCV